MAVAAGCDHQEGQKGLVMEHYSGKYERIEKRYGRRGIFVVFGVLLVISFCFWTARRSPLWRTTVVIANDPVVVVSIDSQQRRVAVIVVPADTQIEAISGYGQYSLESLWKLGTIDKKDGAVLAESIEELLGIPVQWYVGPSRRDIWKEPDIQILMNRIFSWKILTGYVSSSYRTNLSFLQVVQLILAFNGTSRDRHERVVITSDNAITMKEQPDGTTVPTVDLSRLDVLFGNMFENEKIRKDAESVAIYNTTSISSLGSKVGRMLSKLGVFVVSIGNGPVGLSQCELEGSREALRSETAKMIDAIFRCRKISAAGMLRADLELRLGMDYAKRFVHEGN